MFSWFCPADLKGKKILDNVVSEQLKSLEKLDDEAKQRKNDELRELIKYYFELNNRIDERCARIANFSLQFLVLCAIGMGVVFLYKETIGIPSFTIMMVFFSLQVLYLLLITLSYESATRIKDIRYISSEEKTEEPQQPRSIIKDLKRSFSRAFLPWRHKGEPAAYVEGLKSFVRNYHEQDINKKILNNMEQLYMLQAENAYCNRLHLRLRRLRFWSITASVVSGLLLALLFYFVAA